MNDLLREAIGIGVVAVIAAPDESCPYPATWTTWSPRVIATAMPG
nr:hypothetical protein [Micromonospora solifontis]